MTHALMSILKEDRPNESGTITFNFKIKPVSSQASRTKRDLVMDEIRAITKTIKYLLSSDVAVEILWYINEDERYETDESSDVDNIIKPILDALSGPEGILINDCQVQYISSHWVSRFDEEECIKITIKYEPNAWYLKDSIIFVQLHKALCMPLHSYLPPAQLKALLDIFEMQINTRENLLSMGENYYLAKTVMSIQRLFHKTRVNDFKVVTLEDLRAKLKGYAHA